MEVDETLIIRMGGFSAKFDSFFGGIERASMRCFVVALTGDISPKNGARPLSCH